MKTPAKKRTAAELAAAVLWCAGIVGVCMGQGAGHFARRAMHCWNTPESGGTDACTGKFSGTVKPCERHKAAKKQRRDKGNGYERTKDLLG